MMIRSLDELQGHPSLGHSWEGFVIEQIIGAFPVTDFFFYRTGAGAELDLLFINKRNELVAMEIK
jgi:uncharacterized protein